MWRAGAALAGSSAGAEALTAAAYDVETEGWPHEPGLAVIPDIAVVPHCDKWIECRPEVVERVAAMVGPAVEVVGINEDEALIYDGTVGAGTSASGGRIFRSA